jgi:hypothetical protein
MYNKSAKQFDHSLEQTISHYYQLILGHGKVVENFVNDYRSSRQHEIENYKQNLSQNKPAIKPCLLALVLRKNKLTSAKIFQGYFSEEETPLVYVIHLAKISGSYTEHISQMDKSGGYAIKRVANMRSLRISTPNQKEWILSVIGQVNELNAVALTLRKQYLEMVRLHYDGHRYLTSLRAMQ